MHESLHRRWEVGMAVRRTPSVRARQLARELRELRTNAGLTMDQVADGLGWSSAKVSRLETAYTLITVADLNRLLAFYEISGEVADRFVRLARAARERGWWETYSDKISEKYAAFIGLEADAQKIQTYRVGVIDGLLQTPGYARAIVEAGVPLIPPSEVNRVVEIRMKRQSRLRSLDALDLHMVVDEGVLRRRIAGAEVMREQLEHLLRMADLPNVRIQVVPFADGYPTGATFSVLKFQEPQYPEVVYIEQMSGSLIIEDEDEVFKYVNVFRGVCGKALDDADSRALIAQIAAQFSD
ncbi:helix-turn-helix domain-containing protein [Actinomadura sp. 21ATH]|uniref:helix-turn-helix domain-containing protein n=1 Tax=Actinomadura sp. 21ATH TaxID=1735444 RepID=UPI0035BF4BA8